VTTKFTFTRWLRFKQLPMLLSVLLIAVAALQSLHEQLAHDALSTDTHCEFCLLNQSADGGILPPAISLLNPLFNQPFVVLVPLHSSFNRDYSPPTRAPPLTFLA
jgi:hypothetical protein